MVSINDTNHANSYLFQSVMWKNRFINMRRSRLLTDLPFYESVDWKKHYLPCKHMFAVMKKLLGKVFPQGIEILHFSKLILTYLTQMIITNKITIHSKCWGNMRYERRKWSSKCYSFRIISKTVTEKKASTPCRYLLKQIKGHTYLVNNKNVLENLEERLEKILPLPLRLFSFFVFLLILLLKNPLM